MKAILRVPLMFVNPAPVSFLYNRSTASDCGGTGMSRQDALSYHSERATRELDLGMTAESANVARAHFELASMHLDRVREFTGRPMAPLPAVG